MADFKKYYPKLQANEGGYANHPKDSGGETWAGVARNFWPKWPGWKRIDEAKKQFKNAAPRQLAISLNKILHQDSVLADMVFQFYKINYWNSLQLDFVNSQWLAEQLADHGVNAGAMRPAKMIQWIIKNQYSAYQKLKVDGDIGPTTIEAINACDQKTIYQLFVMLRKAFYNFRAGELAKVTEIQRAFFAAELNLRTKRDQVVFLDNWLSRCVPATLPA